MNIIDNIPTGDNLIVGIIRGIAMAETKPRKPNSDDGNKHLLIGALIAALFFVVSSEAYKLVLRKNIGRYALSMLGIVTSSFMFMIWACILIGALYVANFDGSNIDDYSVYVQFLCNKYILFSGAVCYAVFAFYIFIRGIDEYFRAKADTRNDLFTVLYRGDCVIFGSLADTGIPQDKIWLSHEPKACIQFGLILTFIHPLIGFPLLFSAISFKVNEWYHVSYKWQRLQEKAKEMKFEAELANFVQNKKSQKPSAGAGVQ